VSEDAQPHARLPLGEMLIEAGFVSKGQVDEALAESAETGERLGEVVVRRGWATEDDVAMLLAEQWGLNYVASGGIWFESDALMRLSRDDARRVEALPTRIQDGHVVVAVAEPTEERLADLRRLIGDDTVVVVVPKSALNTGLQSELLLDAGAKDGEQGRVVELKSAAGESQPVFKKSGAEGRYAIPTNTAPSGPGAAPPGEGVAALAAQVRGVADAIAALAEYEQRVAYLEAELSSRKQANDEIRELLSRVVQLLDEQPS
jgi:type II secretion system (T2SS) protein E